MANVVLNSLGSETWSTALDVTGVLGRLVFFGTLTGSKVELDLNRIYNRHIRIIGTTGGRTKEFEELIAASKNLRLRIWKKFRLEDGAEAIGSLFAKGRDGRILIET
jgi:NADPH:quinone reductase-like Zn-dependent oxidoreductase